MTDRVHICQWCQHPIPGTPAWWDNRPKCRDPHACNRRLAARTERRSR